MIEVDHLIYKKQLLESEKKYLEALIELDGNEKNILLRKELLKINKNEKYSIEVLIYDKCQHEWIEDSIDISCDKSINIKYCNNCGLECK